jgi:hypothetical protein
MAEARRLKPELSVKWLMGNKYFSWLLQPWYDPLREAGLPEAVNAPPLADKVDDDPRRVDAG